MNKIYLLEKQEVSALEGCIKEVYRQNPRLESKGPQKSSWLDSKVAESHGYYDFNIYRGWRVVESPHSLVLYYRYIHSARVCVLN